jgi:hypothetical protein
MEVLGPVVYQEGLYFIELVIIIEYEHLFANEVQTLKCTCELCFDVRAQFPNLETQLASSQRSWDPRV